MSNKPLLVVIAGPTAAGKTSLSINLAQKLQTEIISADSRQFFQEMLVGTARPTEQEMQGVQHHFTGHMSISESYNVSQYEQDVLKLLHNLFSKHRVVLLTGGSGLYIKAVCEGIDNLPDPDPALRENIKDTFDQYGIEALQKWLHKVDKPYYNQVDLQNPKRLMRAIEVCETSGKKYSELRKNEPKSRFFDTLKIALDMPRQ
ncbi:MAG: tRNA (adenosine(37)-N6)-dimethylallyltransferase MiaA, partial [Bacteroidota bacterium]